jgi:hypothetical protein
MRLIDHINDRLAFYGCLGSAIVGFVGGVAWGADGTPQKVMIIVFYVGGGLWLVGNAWRWRFTKRYKEQRAFVALAQYATKNFINEIEDK